MQKYNYTFQKKMERYHSCFKDDLKLDSPFRLLIVGPMNSGKSTFLTKFINSLYDNVKNVKKIDRTNITLVRYGLIDVMCFSIIVHISVI